MYFVKNLEMTRVVRGGGGGGGGGGGMLFKLL